MQSGNPYPPAPPAANMYAPPGAPPSQYPGYAGYPCARCGGPGADYFSGRNPPLHRACAGLGPDVLDPKWLILAYVVAVPFGCTFFGAIFASVPYYGWESNYSHRAQRYTMHAWI